MPRSRINGNFIDKTFSIVANILLRIIPTTSGEKEAFTYYRDGAIWLLFFFKYLFLFYLPLFFSVLEERHMIWDRKKKVYCKKKSTLFEGEVCKKKNNSFCRVSPINAASDASIVDSSIERKVTPTGYVLWGQP